MQDGLAYGRRWMFLISLSPRLYAAAAQTPLPIGLDPLKNDRGGRDTWPLLYEKTMFRRWVYVMKGRGTLVPVLFPLLSAWSDVMMLRK